jgi:hypothetical protein
MLSYAQSSLLVIAAMMMSVVIVAVALRKAWLSARPAVIHLKPQCSGGGYGAETKG